MPHRKSLATALAGAAIAIAMVVSAASATPGHGTSASEGYVDLRSPDAVDAARQAGHPPKVAPSPASIEAPAAEEYRDLRSPDRRDQTEPTRPPAVNAPHVDRPSPVGGFDWVSAAIGAAAGTGLLILLLAAGGLARRRPVTRGSALGA